MDLYSHRVYIESQRTKQDQQVAASLMRCWKVIGIPDFLQFDNELSFHGSNKYPRSFGIVLKTCLYFGIQPVFIPIGEPWRNGVIEHFNDTYNKKFFRRQWFQSYANLKRQSKNFQRFHNEHHRYSCLSGKTPNEFVQRANYNPMTLGPNTRVPKLDYIPDGNIIVIRFIRSDRKLDVFGEKFQVPHDLVYSYIKAVIVTKIHALQLYLGEDLVKTFEYQLPV
jgi:hypothetical protein